MSCLEEAADIAVHMIAQIKEDPEYRKKFLDSLDNDMPTDGKILKKTEVSYDMPLGSLTIGTQFSVREVEVKQKTKGVLPRVTLNGYRNLSGGYVNYNRYCVVGINGQTRRKNKKIFAAKTAEDAIFLALKAGLSDPFSVTVEHLMPPSERQIAYAHDLGATWPDDACMEDLSAIISRITDDDEDCPTEQLAQHADKAGMMFSMYMGRKALHALTAQHLVNSKKR